MHTGTVISVSGTYALAVCLVLLGVMTLVWSWASDSHEYGQPSLLERYGLGTGLVLAGLIIWLCTMGVDVILACGTQLG